MYTIACFSSQNIRLADDGLITLLFGNIEVRSTANLRICDMLGMVYVDVGRGRRRPQSN